MLKGAILHGVYKIEKDTLLVEMTLFDKFGDIDFDKFYVPDPALDESEYQNPDRLQFLSPDGKERICELYETPSPDLSPVRLAFTLYSGLPELEKEMVTPYGSFSIKKKSFLPRRLKKIIELEYED